VAQTRRRAEDDMVHETAANKGTKKASLSGFVQSVRRTKRRPSGHKRANSGQKRTVAYYTGAIKARGEGEMTTAMFKSHCPNISHKTLQILYLEVYVGNTATRHSHSVIRLGRTVVNVVSVAAASPHPPRVNMSCKPPVFLWSRSFVDPFFDSASMTNSVSVFGIELH